MGCSVVLPLSVAAVTALAPANASGIRLPAVPPEAGTRCTYSGVFPGSGVPGTWTTVAGEQGNFKVELSDVAQLKGILLTRVDPEVTGAATVWTLTGAEQQRGRADAGFQRLDVSFAGGHRLITTVRTESVCADRPRQTAVGASWSCRDSASDTWTLELAGKKVDSGTTRVSSKSVVEYARDEEIDGPNGPVRVAVLEVRRDETLTERRYIDLALPWCPIRVERIRIGQVVGTDRLVAIEVPAPADLAASAPESTDDDSPFAWWWLLITTVLCLFGLFAQVTHRKSRKV